MKMLKVVALFITFTFNSFAADVKISENDKIIIVEQVRSLQQELCKCDDSFEDINIEDIMSTWEPLIVSNIKIFEKLILSLDKIAHVNTVFDRESDPNFMGYAMYMLRLFSQISADANEPLNNQDIKTSLAILTENYDFEIPAIVLDILSKVDRLDVERNKGASEITLRTLDGNPIVVDLTNEDLLGDQEDNKNKFLALKIEDKSTIAFSGDEVTFSECKISGKVQDNCNVTEAGIAFLTTRSRMTSKVDVLTMENAQEAANFLARKKYKASKLSPLFIEFSGFTVEGKFHILGLKTKQNFLEAVVIPGTEEMNSFYLKAHVKAAGGLVDGNVEITL